MAHDKQCFQSMQYDMTYAPHFFPFFSQFRYIFNRFEFEYFRLFIWLRVRIIFDIVNTQRVMLHHRFQNESLFI